MMTNGIKDPVEALRIYRLKDLIEKSFGNLKERLSMRRMSVASEENFEDLHNKRETDIADLFFTA